LKQLNEARKKYGVDEDDFLLLSEKGSGISWDRPKFNEILEKVFAGEVKRILVLHGERLTRSGLTALSKLFARFDTEIISLNKRAEETPEEELLAEITASLFSFGSKTYGARSREKFSYKVSDENLELLDNWQDAGIDGRAIARKAQKLGMRDEKSGKLLTYNWIIRRMRKRRISKKVMLESKGNTFVGSDLQRFFLAHLEKDSNGKSTVGSHLVKKKYEEWAKMEGITINDDDIFWWKDLLEQHGMETFRDATKNVTYIKGWKFMSSRQ